MPRPRRTAPSPQLKFSLWRVRLRPDPDFSFPLVPRLTALRRSLGTRLSPQLRRPQRSSASPLRPSRRGVNPTEVSCHDATPATMEGTEPISHRGRQRFTAEGKSESQTHSPLFSPLQPTSSPLCAKLPSHAFVRATPLRFPICSRPPQLSPPHYTKNAISLIILSHAADLADGALPPLPFS